jgi:hypothetical protein
VTDYITDTDNWRAGVRYEDLPTETLLVDVVRPQAQGRLIYATGLADGVVTAADGEIGTERPPLRIPTGMARALYDALDRHFGSGHEARQLRADYQAERARVDQLTTGMLDVLRALAIPEPEPALAAAEKHLPDLLPDHRG